MKENPKYTHHLEIYNRLAVALKDTDKILRKKDVLSWCQEVETEFCPNVHNMWEYIQFELSVNNSRAFLPCNLWRLVNVYTVPNDPTSIVAYAFPGSFISFNPSLNLTKVYIDYYGTVIDLETGIPMITKGNEQACFWYCMYMLNIVEIMDGRKQHVVLSKEHEILAAKQPNYQHIDHNFMNKIERIYFNMVPIPASHGLLNGEW